MPNLSEINWVDDFVITILFITVKILGLTTVTFARLAQELSYGTAVLT